MTSASGVYKLVHLPTKKFYIGGTRNLSNRFATHKSHFKRGKNIRTIQELYDITKNIDEWKMTVIKLCAVRSLNRVENAYIAKYRLHKDCLNIRKDATGGRRNAHIGKTGRERLAVSLLGKNSSDGIRRPNNLTFISPTGKEYSHIISVKRFCEEHGLSQPQMNNLANGVVQSYMGWTRRGAALPHAHTVLEYWSRERMLQSYPEYKIIGPDGTEYKTFVISYFEEEHDCKVAIEPSRRHSGFKSHTRGLDTFGRGYRLSHIPYFRVTYEGVVYDNIMSLGKFAESLGMTKKKFHYMMASRKLYKTKRKKTKRFTFERITP